mmetsp:Transcript_36703/g.108242  ORF Transcript_36703/g.108242 Transcript_36703/m.108242 type:complete len:260 (+) Transcript_36703:1387-2166(+)
MPPRDPGILVLHWPACLSASLQAHVHTHIHIRTSNCTTAFPVHVHVCVRARTCAWLAACSVPACIHASMHACLPACTMCVAFGSVRQRTAARALPLYTTVVLTQQAHATPPHSRSCSAAFAATAWSRRLCGPSFKPCAARSLFCSPPLSPRPRPLRPLSSSPALPPTPVPSLTSLVLPRFRQRRLARRTRQRRTPGHAHSCTPGLQGSSWQSYRRSHRSRARMTATRQRARATCCARRPSCSTLLRCDVCMCGYKQGRT